jgi:hypothetical protein
MSVAKFKVEGRFNGADGATIEIDRGAGTVTVRPTRQRTTYTLPLATVAELVLWRALKADVAVPTAVSPRRRRNV